MLFSFLSRRDPRELGTLRDEDPEMFAFMEGASMGIYTRIFGG